MKRAIIGLAAVLLATALGWGGNRLRPTRPAGLCALPQYDYQPRDLSNPVSETARGVLTNVTVQERHLNVIPVVAGPPVRLRVFQLNTPQVQSNHCSLSKVTLSVYEDGRWIVNMTARQDPSTVEVRQQPRFVRYTGNQLVVSLRGQGFAPETDNVTTGVVGEPELFKICLKPFWLERGEVQNIRLSGMLKPEEVRGFEAVDQVAVDLQYR